MKTRPALCEEIEERIGRSNLDTTQTAGAANEKVVGQHPTVGPTIVTRVSGRMSRSAAHATLAAWEGARSRSRERDTGCADT